MSDPRLRRHIAIEAAKLMYERAEKEYFTAKRKAAARLGVNFRHHPRQLPSNREIRDQIEVMARIHEGERRTEKLAEMRLAALRLMRVLEPFRPRLIGSVLTGHVRQGSDIDIHVFSDTAAAITELLDLHGHNYQVEQKRVIKQNAERIFTHIHLQDRFDFELTLYARDQVTYTFKSSITGKAIERASIDELADLIAREHPDVDLTDEDDQAGAFQRFLIWSLLLPPLASVRQNPRWHPEGDALYHSLQAFELARVEHPYDQELITACLLHDVGKAIDPGDHVSAGLEALEGTLSPREAFLIAHHMDAQAYRDGTLGGKRRARLTASEWFDDLLTLRDIDNRARRRGAEVCTTEEAVEFLRAMEEEDASFS